MYTTEEGKNRILNRLAKLVSSPGWKHMKKDFEYRIQVLRDKIEQVGGNEVKYSEKDIQIIEKKMLRDILDYPEKYIKELMQPDQLDTEEMDPYEDQT